MKTPISFEYTKLGFVLDARVSVRGHGITTHGRIVGSVSGHPLLFLDDDRGTAILASERDEWVHASYVHLDIRALRWTAPGDPSLISLVSSSPTPVVTVCRCISCPEIARHAEPNLPDGKFQCWSCRQTWRRVG